MKNKKGSWTTWFWIILFLIIVTSAVRHSYYRQTMYDDLTGRIVDSQNEELQQQQEDYYQQSQPQAINIKCTDSDGGKDYYTKGYITHTNGTKEYDHCDTTNPGYEKHVIEFFCTSDGSGQTNYGCPYGCSDGACNLEPQTSAVTVSYVSDGDSIKLSSGEEVRLIGLNAPELGQSCSSEATNKLKELVLGKEVILEQDIDNKDQYGRLLRYIYVGNTFVNLEIVRLGFAHKYEYGSNTEYSSQFGQAENEAKENCGCIWKPCVEDYEIIENEVAESQDDYICTDSDSGKDYYTKGYINRKSGKIEYDYCDIINEGYENYVWEYYCAEEGFGLTNYKCEYGCSDGKCNDEPDGAGGSGAGSGGSGATIPNYISDQCIYITNFHFNAVGDDNYNLNDEYVTLGNRCSYSIDMTSWTIKDETASHLYTIPPFTFQAGSTFTLFTGTGTNTNSALYWGRTSGNYAAIWNNNGDTLFLRDSSGNLVLSQSYSGY